MDITPQIPKNRNVINGYGVGNFKINEKIFESSIILTPNQIVEISLESLEEFFEENLSKILQEDPEILLVGTGKNHQIISTNLKNKIKAIYPNIAIDEMSTASACRTYNILMMEDRKVAALLLAINP